MVVSVVPVLGRNFRTKSKKKKKEEDEKKKRRETAKRQSPGARDTLTTGQVLIAVAASSFLETTLDTSVVKTFANTRRCIALEPTKGKVNTFDAYPSTDRRFGDEKKSNA